MEADDDSDAEDIDENFIIQSSDILENKKTLRDSSPFTAHFKEISNSFVDSSRNSDTNPLYNIAYIDFLLLNFMPYTGIWCSIGLRDTTLSRLSNGIIEKLWQYKKGKNNYSQYSANYTNSSLQSTRGQALKVKKWYSKLTVDDQSSDSDLENPSVTSSESETDINAPYSHQDYWSKKSRNIKPNNKKKKKINVGYYQKPSKALRPEKIAFNNFVIPTAAVCYNEAKTSLPDIPTSHEEDMHEEDIQSDINIVQLLLDVDAEFGPGNFPIANKLPLEIVGIDEIDPKSNFHH